MVRNFFSVENSIDHVTAEEPHFYLIPSMRVYFVVLVDRFKDVGGGGPVRKLEVVKSFFIDVEFIPFLKIFDWHILQHYSNFTVGVLKH